MRRRKAKKRIILPDPRFNDITVTKFVNNLMLDGKKSLSFNIFYDAMDIITERTSEDALEIFRKGLTNITPAVEVRSRRVGGATFQIPQPIRDSRKESMAMKWLISLRARETKRLWLRNWLVSWLLRRKKKVPRLRRKKIHTEWLRLTRHSLTSDFRSDLYKD